MNRATMNGKPVFTVPAKTVINFKSGFEHKKLCDGPTFSAGTACVYSCAFCYVPDMFKKMAPALAAQGVVGKHEDIVIRRANAAAIAEAQLTDKHGHPKFLDVFDKRVIFSSPAVDVAGNMELVEETVYICKAILTKTNWQIRLLSKSNLLPEVAKRIPDFDQHRMIYGVSTGTLDDGLARVFEQGTPLVSKRIESLHWLQDHGHRTFGMICPSLPQSNYWRFAAEMSAAIRSEKCEHVWAEVINARGESFARTLAALRAGGYEAEAVQLETVGTDRMAWEHYARQTFAAHSLAYTGTDKLRFLQYVTADTRGYWQSQEGSGAILL